MARLKEMYKADVAPALMKKYEYKSVMQIPKLDKIVVNVGAGDAKENTKVIDNIIAMCRLAQANGIVPIISSIPPCSEFPWRKEIINPGQTIVDINKSLRAYAEANGLVYIDYHAALADENLGFPKSLSDDGCHPNPDTYFTMEEMALESIRVALKK